MKHGLDGGVSSRLGFAGLFLLLLPSACGTSGSGAGGAPDARASGGAAATGGVTTDGAPSAGATGGTNTTGGTAGGSSAGGGPSTCSARAMCTSVTLAHVNTLCGTSAATPVPVDSSAPPAQNIDICLYQDSNAAGQQAVTSRYCFTDAATATGFFSGEHDRMPSVMGETQTDLTGLGDRAFYRAQVDQSTTSVYVLKGNLIAMAEVDVVTTSTEAAVKECLITLTNEILSL